MARGRPRKKVEENINPEKSEIQEAAPLDEQMITDDDRLPDKSLFRVDEVMQYFGISESTVRLWIQHGHLEAEKIVGSVRIKRESILSCRFKNVA